MGLPEIEVYDLDCWRIDSMNGKKTYVVVAAMIVYAVAGLFLGKIDGNAGVQVIGAALAMAGLRHGVAKN